VLKQIKEQEEEEKIEEAKKKYEQQLEIIQEPDMVIEEHELSNDCDISNISSEESERCLSWAKIQGFVLKICESRLFTLFINSCIILNTLVLAVDRYPSLGNELDYMLDMVNIVFFGIFTMEMLIKLLGMGPKNYVRDSFNIFDAVIVVLSIADVCLSFLVETS